MYPPRGGPNIGGCLKFRTASVRAAQSKKADEVVIRSEEDEKTCQEKEEYDGNVGNTS